MYSKKHSNPLLSGDLLNVATLGKALFLGAASILVSNVSASAVESITLKYYGSDPSVPSETTVTLNEIKQFVESGELQQQLQEFLDVNLQEPGPIQRAMTARIRVPDDIGQDFLESSTGEFVLLQLRKLIQDSEDLTDLRTALRTSIEDDRYISILEVIENYPQSNITLDITGLVTAYNDVSAFVERILPALEVAKGYLQDIVCDCEQVTPTATLDSPQSNGPQSNGPQSNAPKSQLVPSTAVNCPDARTAATPPAP
jgi:hypothetical protein